MRRVITPLIGAVVAAVALAGAANAIPEQGTPDFDNYMQALQRNGFNLNPDTAWRIAHQACEGGIPGFLGYELVLKGLSARSATAVDERGNAIRLPRAVTESGYYRCTGLWICYRFGATRRVAEYVLLHGLQRQPVHR